MSRSQLPRSPLVLVVAQIQFSPVEGIKEKYVSVIQDQLRISGFPYYEIRLTQQITAAEQGLQLLHQEQLVFTNKSKQTNIVVTKNSLTVNTVNYTIFDNFLHDVGSIVKEVSTILKLTDFGTLEQVSLRYVDWICPLNDVVPEKMINEKYLGGFLNDSDGVQLRQVVLERKTSVDGVVRSILFRPKDYNIVLAEFQSTKLDQPKFSQQKEGFLILDMEHLKRMQGKDFSHDLVQKTLKELHHEVDSLFFEQIPTKEALALWGKEAE
ncbi:MAG: TIGR04255 family protein [Planctomycetaceae bacterium]|jgi:uncharacterized protein (TIGR04255 family)|nr:TIGR04255 family protein [Planctomycetaceae bacterium]